VTALDRIVEQSRRIGYRADAILRDYVFNDFSSPAARDTRIAPLAVFTQTPPSYRSAAFGAADIVNDDAEATVRAHRALGAPLFFVIEADEVSVWQVYASGPPRMLERASLSALEHLFEDKKSVWSPDAIHRAKSIGRFNRTYQLDFVDAGLMPAIEGQVHQKLDRLLNDALEVTSVSKRIEEKALFRGIFRLLAAKILIDRAHSASKSWRGRDVQSVLQGIEDYYGLKGTQFDTAAVAGELDTAWEVLSAGINVANISADDLAFVYENTLVTPKTREMYGTHSTPRHVAEYVVGRLQLESHAENPPTVFEPFAGAGVFLVSALRHLREALPHSWGDRERHDFLVRRISGAEIDAFACEVATLSLILADYPNKNGWKIENSDLFINHTLAKRFEKSEVILCNPPFEIFTAEERKKYPEVAAISGAKAEAVLALALAAKPKALGFVLPRTFLIDKAYREQRRAIERMYREVELVALPDGVFTVSQVESALLIAKDPASSGDRQAVRASEVFDHSKQAFASTGLPSSSREEKRVVPDVARGDLWIPPLAPLWQKLKSNPRLGGLVDGHWGLRWSEGRQGEAQADGPGPNRVRGFLRTEGLHQFFLGRAVWLDCRPSRIYGGMNYGWSEPKILLNAGRFGRGYWRHAAAVDRKGLYASQQFVGLWPRPGVEGVDLDALAAVLNGPLANAFMADHSSEKRLRIETLLAVPIPRVPPPLLGELAREYAQLAAHRDFGNQRDERLAALLDRIDVLVLEAYDLPPRMERSLLAAFEAGERRLADERRRLTHDWQPWRVANHDPAFRLAELRAGILERSRSDWVRQQLKPLSKEEALKATPYLP
jgi:hypothetical protein